MTTNAPILMAHHFSKFIISISLSYNFKSPTMMQLYDGMTTLMITLRGYRVIQRFSHPLQPRSRLDSNIALHPLLVSLKPKLLVGVLDLMPLNDIEDLKAWSTGYMKMEEIKGCQIKVENPLTSYNPKETTSPTWEKSAKGNPRLHRIQEGRDDEYRPLKRRIMLGES